MANRFWVGGTGTWNATAGSKWSTTSGGGSGAAAPTASDDVFIDGNSGAGTVTIGSGAVCRSLNFTGFTGTLAGINNIVVGTSTSGNVTFASGMTITWTGYLRLESTTTGNQLTMNGKAIANMYLFGTGSWTLMDTMTVNTLVLWDSGNLDISNRTVNWGALDLSATTNARTFNITNATVNITGNNTTSTISNNVWDFGTSAGTGITLTSTGSTINFTDATANNKTIQLGGKTYNAINISSGGAGIVILRSSPSVATLTINAPKSVRFQQGQTFTITSALNATGTAGNIITIDSNTAGSAATISKASGEVSCDYLSLKDSAATGGASFYAGANSTNVSGNSGWTFTAPPTPSIGGWNPYYSKHIGQIGSC